VKLLKLSSVVSRVTVSWSLFLCLVVVGAAVRGAFGKSTVMTMAMHRYRLDLMLFSLWILVTVISFDYTVLEF